MTEFFDKITEYGFDKKEVSSVSLMMNSFIMNVLNR